MIFSNTTRCIRTTLHPELYIRSILTMVSVFFYTVKTFKFDPNCYCGPPPDSIAVASHGPKGSCQENMVADSVPTNLRFFLYSQMITAFML